MPPERWLKALRPCGTGGVSADQQESEEKQQERVFVAWLRGGIDVLNREDRMFAMKRVQAYQDSFKNDIGTGTGGSYLVPPAFSGQLLVTLKEYFTALNLFDMIETSTGADLPWPTNDDTARRAKIIGENQQINKGDMQFGQISLQAFLYATDPMMSFSPSGSADRAGHQRSGRYAPPDTSAPQ